VTGRSTIALPPSLGLPREHADMPALRPPRLPVRPVRRGLTVPSMPEEPFADPATITTNGLRWIHIPKPRQAVQEWLEQRFEFHPLDYEDVYSRNQRPKVDRYDDYLFVVLQFPRFDRERDRLTVVELDLFVGPDYVITLPNAELEPIDSLFARCQESEEVREGYFEKGSAFLLYKIIDHAVDASFPMLRKMGQKLERIEDEIFEGHSEAVVRDISNAKQEIINFRRIVRPQRVAFRDLERAMDVTTPEELDVYFDDVIDASERIWDTLENYKEIIEGLESTNESVLSHNVNDILRVLTSFSVIVLPLTLVASLFGMNVLFPGEGTQEAFWVVVIIMAAMLVGLVAFFRNRGWL
jgi:magnesium transporter